MTTPTFNELIAQHLHAAKIANDLTNAEMAARLGLERGNYISMLIRHPNEQSPLPLKRLCALAESFDLSVEDSARLLLLRAKHHPDAPTALDLPTLGWVHRTLTAAQARSCRPAAALEEATK